MVKALEDIIAKSSSIVFFGGAGVSTESGSGRRTRRSFTVFTAIS